jgi:hypothetical protein
LVTVYAVKAIGEIYEIFNGSVLIINDYFGGYNELFVDSAYLFYLLFLNICQIFGFFSDADYGGFIAVFERSVDTYKLYNLKGSAF